MQQAEDFRAESRSLAELIDRVTEDQLGLVTGFKGWTIEDVVRHLHVWNENARLSLLEPERFQERMATLMPLVSKGGGLNAAESKLLPDLKGAELVGAWCREFEATANAFATADPTQRVAWAGPSMSARSSVTARLMETWAHGQEIYDVVGVEREDADRIRNIVVLGVNTFGWTFKVRGEEPPGAMPHLVLTAPSGDVWTYGDESADRIEGLASEFCQVVTQTRNIADTQLTVTGPVATAWMDKAQCFAGAATEPPAPGSRAKAASSLI